MLINKKSGITLIELLITVALSSFLLVLGFQGFGKMETMENLKSSTQQAAFAIKKARYYATAKGVITRINFAVNKNVYSITADKTLTDIKYFDAMSGTLGAKVTIASNTCGNLGFYVDGTPINSAEQPISANCVITLSLNGNKKAITIQAGTGNVIYDK